MEKFIAGKFVMFLVLGTPIQQHAFGLFSTERNCWKWAEMMNQSAQVEWVGRCMTLTEFRREHPTMRINEGS